MKVRPAVFSDIPEMLVFGRAAHARSDGAHLEFDEDGARLLGAQCITTKRLCAFVAEDGGKIVGILLGQVQDYPYLKAQFATDVAFVSARFGAGRILLQRFIVWAFEERRVAQVMLGVSFGGKSAQSVAFFKRMGFKRTGGIFVMNRSQ